MLQALKQWTEKANLIALEKGFKQGTLWAVAWKSVGGGPLYTCFVDFRTAFDLVNWEILWTKLESLKIPGGILGILKELHNKNWARVELDCSGSLCRKISIESGLCQGCVLAPILFALYLADLPKTLLDTHSFSP